MTNPNEIEAMARAIHEARSYIPWDVTINQDLAYRDAKAAASARGVADGCIEMIVADAIASVGSHETDAIFKMARAAIAAMSSQNVIPHGCVVVPEKPTQLMLDSVDDLAALVGQDLPAENVWSAMLSAASSSPAAVITKGV